MKGGGSQPPGQRSNPTAKALPFPTLPRLTNPARAHKRAHRLTHTLTRTPQPQRHPLPRPQARGPGTPAGVSSRDVPLQAGVGGGGRSRLTSPGPPEPCSPWFSSCLISPPLPRFPFSPPLRSFVCCHFTELISPSPPGRPCASLPWVSGVSPLPYPLPALARSPPAPHNRTADGRGGREGRLRGWIREWIWCLLATPGQLSPPGFSRPSPTVLSRCGAELPRPDLAPSFPCTLAVAISLPLVCLADQIWSCAPPSSTPFPLGCHLRPPAPSSAAPFVTVAVAGSAGDIQGPPVLSPSTKARSGCWLRAWLSRGLIITSPQTLNLTQTLSPWLGDEGKGLLAGWGPRHHPNLPLQAFQRQVPAPFAQHPIHVLFFFTPLLPTTPPLGQASPHCLISALALAG